MPSEDGAERAAVERVVQAVAALGLGADRLERLRTAVAETVVNAVEHGNKGRRELPVAVRVTASASSLEVAVTDQVGNRPVPEAPEPDLEAKLAGAQDPRGWGLFLIRNMVDDLRDSGDSQHHTVHLVIRGQRRGRGVRGGRRPRRPPSGRRGRMNQETTTMDVRQVSGVVSVVDIRGDVTAGTGPDGVTVAQTQVLLRANDPLYELAMPLAVHRREDRFWQQTLTNLARQLGVADPVVTTTAVCVDRRRQWSNAGNLWHNAGIRTALYTLAAPLRALRPTPRGEGAG